jgi:hypothetical protein
MATIQETFARLATLDMIEAGKPASKEEVQQIEAALGIVLPDQYVKFLNRFGSVRSFGWQILGTRPVRPAASRPTTLTQDCVQVTTEQRKNGNLLGTASLPPAHVVISQDGGGGNIVLFGVGAPHEGEVHYYNFEDRAEPIRVWKTFQDYLEDRIAEAGGR